MAENSCERRCVGGNSDLDFGDDQEQREEEGVSAHEKHLLVVNCAEVK